MRRVNRMGAITVAFVLLPASCSSDTARPADVTPIGPPEVQADVVSGHARQFDEEIPERAAGSQQEQIASTYILGHLQQAGYLVRLEGVPVENLVESTDVIAVPPVGNRPRVVVAVAYDAEGAATSNGAAIGLFLELARAFRVRVPEHSTEFAALGADRTVAERLGSRRLARLLLDADDEPVVVVLSEIAADRTFAVAGSESGVIGAIARAAGVDPIERTGAADSDVFAEAGFHSVVVSGDPVEVALVLLEFLEAGGS